MLIVDAHLDLAMNALQWNRDLLQSVYTIRTQENYTPGKGRGQGTVAFPEMRRGRVALSFATALARSTGRPVPHMDFLSPTQAYAVAVGHLAYYRALERRGYARIVTDAAGLDAHMEAWEAWEARGADEAVTPPLGFVFSMEGADPILDPDQLEEWVQAGLRVLGPTHYGPGRYAGGTGTEVGLTDLGTVLLAAMRRLGVLLDLTHLSDQAFWEALERYDGPVLASHTNVRALAPHQRQFTDEQITAIAARGGVIGAAFDNWMILPGWRHGDDPRLVKLEDVVRHIDHICQLLGTARHCGIGSDLDGGFGREGSPGDLDTIADLQRIAALLAERGYSADDVAGIMYRNWWTFLRRAWSPQA
ncbi:MAG: membrane dipeptidase [Armatimonadota bacterium]|nr:membrane dipeptidase [Armatimonadota bacterium]MDR7534706.1 membrane dipeptidase [Armatimonadota bacterium]MDR7534948.1 membrane dipeptidase [Armatimonadota bacterium]